jgi:hypothetical protein
MKLTTTRLSRGVDITLVAKNYSISSPGLDYNIKTIMPLIQILLIGGLRVVLTADDLVHTMTGLDSEVIPVVNNANLTEIAIYRDAGIRSAPVLGRVFLSKISPSPITQNYLIWLRYPTKSLASYTWSLITKRRTLISVFWAKIASLQPAIPLGSCGASLTSCDVMKGVITLSVFCFVLLMAVGGLVLYCA